MIPGMRLLKFYAPDQVLAHFLCWHGHGQRFLRFPELDIWH